MSSVFASCHAHVRVRVRVRVYVRPSTSSHLGFVRPEAFLLWRCVVCPCQWQGSTVTRRTDAFLVLLVPCQPARSCDFRLRAFSHQSDPALPCPSRTGPLRVRTAYSVSVVSRDRILAGSRLLLQVPSRPTVSAIPPSLTVTAARPGSVVRGVPTLTQSLPSEICLLPLLSSPSRSTRRSGASPPTSSSQFHSRNCHATNRVRTASERLHMVSHRPPAART